jgi:hypothetical protein
MLASRARGDATKIGRTHVDRGIIVSYSDTVCDIRYKGLVGEHQSILLACCDRGDPLSVIGESTARTAAKGLGVDYVLAPSQICSNFGHAGNKSFGALSLPIPSRVGVRMKRINSPSTRNTVYIRFYLSFVYLFFQTPTFGRVAGAYIDF